MLLCATLHIKRQSKRGGDIEYLTGIHISVQDPRGLHMNDQAQWAFDQPYMVLFLCSTKILLMHLKCEMIMVLHFYTSLYYWYCNIGLFSIAPCKVISLILLCILFGIISLFVFLITLSKVITPRITAIAIVFDVSHS